MSSPQLELRAVTKHYEGGRIEALRGVDLAVTAGEFVTISGPSGSGKSTILHLLGGLDSPTTGEVLFQNSSLGSASDTDNYRSRHVGFIFQAFHLLPTLSAIENVQVAMLAAKRADHHAERAETLLRDVGLKNRLHYPPRSFPPANGSASPSPAPSPILQGLSPRPPTGVRHRKLRALHEHLTGIQQERGMTLIVVTTKTTSPSAPRHIRIRDGRIEA